MKVLIVFALAIVAVLGDDFMSRVVGGREAVPHSAPYIVSLRGTSNNHFCGGSIIAADWVITAAHCVKSGQKVNVVAGGHNLGDSDVQTRQAAAIYNHEKYTGEVAPNDISLIRLDKPFVFNANIGAIAMPAAGKIHAGDVTLFGWGSVSKTAFASMPKTLQTVTKPIVPYSECLSVLGSKSLANTNVCTGPLSGGISACSGDSGGPLVQSTPTGLELVGIVSWGSIPCGQTRRPSVYTRVSAFIDWVNNKKATFFMV